MDDSTVGRTLVATAVVIVAAVAVVVAISTVGVPGPTTSNPSAAPSTAWPSAATPQPAPTDVARSPSGSPASGLPTATPGPDDPSNQGNCDRSYGGVCIPPPPPILECEDLWTSDFLVQGDDPHGFDPDGDGIGCESDEGG